MPQQTAPSSQPPSGSSSAAVGRPRLTRQQIYRRRRITVFGGLALILGAFVYLPLSLTAPLAPTAATASDDLAAPPVTATALDWPETSQAAAVGAVGYPGVLASTGAQDARPIASITKLITALVTLEHRPISLEDHGEAITMTAQDVAYHDHFDSIGVTVEPVTVGIRLTPYQVMQAALMASAANYAHTLVDWAFESDAAFIAAATDWLDRHGLHDTTVVEPTGLDTRNASTPSDLILLGKIALEHPVVAEIVSTTSVTLPGGVTLENTNEILGTNGVDGLKTGTLPEAGACLLFSSDFTVGDRSVTVVGVALGGKLHSVQYPQIQRLIQSVQANFHEVTVVEAGRRVATYDTPWGASAGAVTAEALTTVLWGGDVPIAMAVEANPVLATDPGDAAGMLRVTIGASVHEVPLTLDDTLKGPGAFWRLTNPVALFAG